MHTTDNDVRRLALVGDVHGDARRLVELLERAVAEHQIELALQVGDLEAVRDEDEQAQVYQPKGQVGFAAVAAGTLRLPVPLYFTGGNHEPWRTLDTIGIGEVLPNVHFLGRAGRQTIGGIRVAYLSGVHSPQTAQLTAEERRRAGKRRHGHWVQEEVDSIRGRADILLTHEWPAGLPGEQRSWEGGRAIKELSQRLRPQVHACGHMHRRLSTRSGRTRIEALGALAEGGEPLLVLERHLDGTLRNRTLDMSGYVGTTLPASEN